jgi:small acid-soluble spore protein B (major beta-type SASP)
MYSYLSRWHYIQQEVIKLTNTNQSKLAVPGAKQALDQMKYEIASEFGVQLGADSTARQNGSVGGEITKRLVRMAQSNLNR